MPACPETCVHGSRCIVGYFHGVHHARDGCYWSSAFQSWVTVVPDKSAG